MMRLEETLFYRNKSIYDETENKAIVELQRLRKNYRVKDDIFSILRSRKDLHLIRFSVPDPDFCAFTLKKSERYFVFINTHQPLEKQIFSAAHELYHYLYDRDFWERGEILNEIESQFTTKHEGELKANCFAACFLVPKNHLEDEILMMKESDVELKVVDLVKLMDSFAVPYKTIVLRLHETGYLDKETTEKFLNIADRDPQKGVLPVIQATGYALRWQSTTAQEVEYGNLLELVKRNFRSSVSSYKELAQIVSSLGLDEKKVLVDEE